MALTVQKKWVGETNILQQILCKSVDRFRRYGRVYISQYKTKTNIQKLVNVLHLKTV